MKKGDIIKLNIESYAYEGKGIARVEQSLINPSFTEEGKKYVIFVHGSYPDDIVNARITKLRKSFGEAKTVEVLSPAKERTEALCKYFGICGGCKQQDLDYQYQLKYKAEQVKDIFERMGGFNDFDFLPIVPSENIYHYRNKMEFSFTQQRWLTEKEINSSKELDKNFALGFHVPKVFSKVIDIEECHLQSDLATSVLNFTRDFLKSRNTSIYSTFTHSGYLRNLVLRESFFSKEFMINIVTLEENDELMKEYSADIISKFPRVTTIINNINSRKAQVAIGEREIIYHGKGLIYDHIGKYQFRISANSFFQTNTLQADMLYDTALNFGEFKKDDIVYDLYSGAGTISIYVSEYVSKVIGFESVDSAVKDARVNCDLNKISNTKFYKVDLNKSFTPFVDEKKIPKPSVIIADPPRGGMNPKTIRDILNLEPERIVYVSCNPTTQVRDIKSLCEEKYKLVKIQPVDMFPQTYHIENVALLTLK